MAKKYINVEPNYGKLSQVANPEENLIFCYYSFDTLYDIKSEDLGTFYDYGYIKDDEVIWEIENTGDYKIEFNGKYDFMERVERDRIDIFGLYINKHKKKDIEVVFNEDGFDVIYKDKYKFKLSKV